MLTKIWESKTSGINLEGGRLVVPKIKSKFAVQQGEIARGDKSQKTKTRTKKNNSVDRALAYRLGNIKPH